MVKYNLLCLVPVAHGCNPSYLGGWDWEDQCLRPTEANSSHDPISKITRAKWSRSVTKVVGYLLCKQKALSSNPSPINHHHYYHHNHHHLSASSENHNNGSWVSFFWNFSSLQNSFTFIAKYKHVSLANTGWLLKGVIKFSWNFVIKF
jgi:hypothetical protein